MTTTGAYEAAGCASNEASTTARDQREQMLIDQALARAGITVGKPSQKSPRMTRAKAERLVAALAAVRECEDAPDEPAYDDVRASLEPWL